MINKKVFIWVEYATKSRYKFVQAISEDETKRFEYTLDQDNYDVDVQKMLGQFTTFCKEQCGLDNCKTCEVYLLKDVPLCDTLLSYMASVDWASVCCLEWLYDRYVLHTKPIQYYKQNGKLHKVYYKDNPIPNVVPFVEYITHPQNITGPHLTKAVYHQLVQDIDGKTIKKE